MWWIFQHASRYRDFCPSTGLSSESFFFFAGFSGMKLFKNLQSNPSQMEQVWYLFAFIILLMSPSFTNQENTSKQSYTYALKSHRYPLEKAATSWCSHSNSFQMVPEYASPAATSTPAVAICLMNEMACRKGIPSATKTGPTPSKSNRLAGYYYTLKD